MGGSNSSLVEELIENPDNVKKAKKLFKSADKDESDSLTKDEWVSVATEFITELHEQAKKEVAKEERNLSKKAKIAKLTLKNEEIKSFVTKTFDSADTDKDGKVTFDEFKGFLKKNIAKLAQEQRDKVKQKELFTCKKRINKMVRRFEEDKLYDDFLKECSGFFDRDDDDDDDDGEIDDIPEVDEPLVPKGPLAYIEIDERPFHNWAQTVTFKASVYENMPTLGRIQHLVNKAKDEKKRLRVSGFRHSWSPIFGDDDCFHISTVKNWRSPIINQPVRDEKNDLQVIKHVKDLKNGNGIIRIGAYVTNDMLRVWSGENDYHLPLNVILVEITFSGSTSAMCHGAGLTNKTLSDLIHAIDYIDHDGQPQRLERERDGTKFFAAIGSFGLFGVITHLEMELKKGNWVAKMEPYQPKMEDGIPRITDNDPKKVDNFTRDAKKYYSEWFWFPGSDKLWVNCWDAEIMAKDKKPDEFPSKLQTKFEALSQVLADELKKMGLSPKQLTKFFSTMAMKSLGSQAENVRLCDGLHFRRGLHNVHARDCEALIEIPEKNGEPDLDLVREVWWKAIDMIKAEETKDNYPIRIALEMRLMGGSDALLAPEYKNKWTCSIEVLTFTKTDSEKVDYLFEDFVQSLVDQWYAIAQRYKCRFRLHWAKEWRYKVNNMTYLQYAKEEMKEELNLFAAQVPEEAWERFSNSTFDELFSRNK